MQFGPFFVLAAVLCAGAASAAALFESGATTSGFTVCGGNPMSLAFTVDDGSSSDVVLDGVLDVRTDLLQARFAATATFADGAWSLSGSEWVLRPEHELCDCAADASSADCADAVDDVCGDNEYAYLTELCAACPAPANASLPTCGAAIAVAALNVTEQGFCDDGLAALCDCYGIEGACDDVVEFCASGEVNDTAICTPCEADVSSPFCEGNITAALAPMVETQQCGAYADALCVCEGLTSAERAVSSDCGTAAYGTLGDATYGFVAITCFVSYSWASDECHEAVTKGVEMRVANQNCRAYEAPDLCLCALGESDDCTEATKAVCYTDAAADYDAAFCTECLANSTSPECLAETAAAVEDKGCADLMCYCQTPTDAECALALAVICTESFASNYNLCWNCAVLKDTSACGVSIYTELASTDCSGAVVAGACDDAPSDDECAALKRGPCTSGGMCGECLTDFVGDPAPSDEKCTGVLQGCTELFMSGGVYDSMNDTTWVWDEDSEPFIEGGYHYYEVLDDAECGAEPHHLYFTDLGLWALDEDTDVTNGIIMAALVDVTQVQPTGTWYDVQLAAMQNYIVTVTCADDSVDRTLAHRVAERLFESSFAAAPSRFHSYGLIDADTVAVDADYCSPFMWIKPPVAAETDFGANVFATSVDDHRVVAFSPDADEWDRVIESPDLGVAEALAFLPNGTLVVSDYDGFKMFDVLSGEYRGSFMDIFAFEEPNFTHKKIIYASRDPRYVYLAYESNVDTGSATKANEIEVIDLELEESAMSMCTVTPAAGFSRDLTETVDGMHILALIGANGDGSSRSIVLRCPTPANAAEWDAIDMADNDTIPWQTPARVCAASACVHLSDDFSYNAGGIVALPDGSFLVSSPEAGQITRHSPDGTYIEDFASASSTGFEDFTPNKLTLSPAENAVFVTDELASSPYVFDFMGTLLGTLSAGKGFASSGGGIVVQPGMYAPRSNFSVADADGGLVAGEPMLVTMLALDALGDVVSDRDSYIQVSFASVIDVGGDQVVVAIGADVADEGAGRYSSTYTTTSAGEFEVAVTDSLFGTHFAGSPLSVTVAPAAADAGTSTMSGDGLSSHAAGEPATFTVQLNDAYGNARPDADLDAFEVQIEVGGGTLPEADIQVTDNGDGTVDFTYTSETSGQHLVTLLLDGEAVAASPYVVYIAAAAPDSSYTTVSYTGSVTVGDAVSVEELVIAFVLDVELHDQFGNALSEVGHADRLAVEAYPTAGLFSCVGAEDLLDGTYRFECPVGYEITAEHGTPYARVTLDGESVDGSPLRLDYEITVEVAGFVTFAGFLGLAALCLALTVGVAVLTVWKRGDRVMNAASPLFMYIILLGCVLEFVVVPLFGVDLDVSSDPDTREAVCRARPWLIGVGFQLAFGAIFAKTWRIWLIFMNKGLKKVTCKNSTLLKIVAAFVGIEVLYLVAWTAADPMQLTTEVKSSSASGITVFERCVSDNQGAWLAVNYAYKGVILSWGTRLAYRVRTVQGRFNESKWIALSLYNMLVMGAILVPVSHLVSDSPSASFLLAAAGLIMSTTVILLLMFGPKFYTIFALNGQDYAAAAAAGTAATQGQAGGGSGSNTTVSARDSPAVTQLAKDLQTERLRVKVLQKELEAARQPMVPGQASPGSSAVVPSG